MREKLELAKAASGACFLFGVHTSACPCLSVWMWAFVTAQCINRAMNHLLQNWSALKDCLAQSSPCFSVGGVGVGGEGRGGGTQRPVPPIRAAPRVPAFYILLLHKITFVQAFHC